MPAPRTTRTTTAPDITAPDITAPDTVGPDMTADDPGTQDGATGPATAPAVAPDSPAPRASTRPRRGTRRPSTATAMATASDDTVPEPGTDSAPPDTAAPDPAAAEATTDDAAPASVADTDTDTGDRGDRGPVADDVWAELRKQPGCTATELARSVPASRSVVLKLLNRWCAEGSVDTTPGATTRAATGYFALPSTLPPADTTITTTDEPTSAAPSETTTPGETRTPQEATPQEPTPQEMLLPPQDETAHTGTADTHSDTGTPEPARTNSSGSLRLGSGALHGMVEDFLREHPDVEHGPVAVARAVGRSSGAVANALERMVSSGWAVRTSDKPKRYRITDTSDDAPTPTPVPAPGAAASAAPTAVSAAPTAAVDIQGVAPVGPVVSGAADGGPGDVWDDGTDNAAAGATARARRGGRVSDGSARSGRKERATTVPG